MDIYGIYSHLGTEGLIFRIWVLHMVPAPFIFFFKTVVREGKTFVLASFFLGKLELG